MLPEIQESEASGDLAALYGRIKQIQGAPVVNFIWRHLATVEGGLPWAWTVAEAALPRIAAAIGPLLAEADRCLEQFGVAKEARLRLAPDAAAEIVRAYERGNSWNVLAMTVLTAVRGGGHLVESRGAVEAMAPVGGRVPPLPQYDSLNAQLRECVDRLGAAGPAAHSGVRPSLWIHLGLWPELLRHVDKVLTPVLASPGFRDAHRALLARTVTLLALEPLAEPLVAAPIDVAVARFRKRIPEMLLIGRVMVHSAVH